MLMVVQLAGLRQLCEDNMPYALGIRRAHAAAIEEAGQPFPGPPKVVLVITLSLYT